MTDISNLLSDDYSPDPEQVNYTTTSLQQIQPPPESLTRISTSLGLDPTKYKTPPLYPQAQPTPTVASSVSPSVLSSLGLAAPRQPMPTGPVQTAYGTVFAPEMQGQAAMDFTKAIQSNTLSQDPALLRRVAGFTTQLYHYGRAAGNQEMVDAAEYFRFMSSDIIPDEIVSEYGLDLIPLRSDKPGGILGAVASVGQAVPGTFVEWFGENVSLPLLNFMDSFSQGALTAIGTVRANPTDVNAWWTGAQAFSQGVTYGSVGNIMEGLGLIDEVDEQGVLKAARAKLDQDGDGTLNWREVQGLHSEGGGRLAGFFDTILVGIFDPLTYVGFGAAGRARAGLTAVAATQGDDVARAVARNGLGILDDRAMSEVTRFIEYGVAQSQAARRAGIWRRTGLADDAVARQVDSQLRALQGPVGALSFAGQNVRIPVFDAAVYTLRPGFGTGLSRMGAAARDIFDPAVDATDTLNTASVLFNGADEVVALTDSELSARIAGGLSGGAASSGARITSGLLDDAGNRVGTITRTITDDRYAEIALDVMDGADLEDHVAKLIADTRRLEREGFHTIRVDAPGNDPLFWSSRGYVPDTTRSAVIVRWMEQLETKLDDVMEVVDSPRYQPPQQTLDLGGLTPPPTAITPPPQPAEILREIQRRVAAAKAAPTSANVARVVDPANRAGWDELARILGGLSDMPMLPLVRGLGAEDALRVIRGGGPTLSKRIAGSRIGRRFGQAFRPRSELQLALDDYAEAVFDGARVRSEAAVSNRMKDLLARLERKADAAARAMSTLDEADRVLREEVLEFPVHFGMSSTDSAIWQVDNVIRANYPEAMADYAAVVVQIRSELDDLAAKNGLENLRESYFPRTLTEEGRQLLLDSPNVDEALRRLGLDPLKIRGHEGRFHNPRTFMPDATVSEANRELAKILDLPLDTKLFEENVMAAFATRGYAAYKAAAQLDMLKGLSNEYVTIDGARRAMVMDLQPGMRVPDGYRLLNDIDDGRFVALREVADEIERFHRVITNDEAAKAMHKNLDSWTQTWGAYATAPVIDGFGFHSRNGVGNVMLNAVAGIGPQWYPRAIDVQAKLHTVFKHMRLTGKSFDDTLDVADLGITDTDKVLFRALRDEDIINAGWFEQMSRDAEGLGRPRAARDSHLTPRRGLARKLRLETYDNSWDFLNNNVMVRSGRAFGTAVESNARIAHFMARINAGDTPAQASRSVRKYLFDYSDLTATERKLRMFSRFYTFMRKNASVQIYGLTRYPGRVHAVQRAVTGGDPGAGIVGFGQGLIPGQPDYSKERGDSLRITDRLVGGFETPLQAFAESFWTPTMTFAAMLSGDVDRREFLTSLLGLTSGGPRSIFDNLMIDIAKYNPAFNREAIDRELGAENTAIRWIESLAGPFYSQLERTIQRMTAGEGVGFIGNDSSIMSENHNVELLIYSNILGMNIARIEEPDEVERDTLWMLDQELRMILDGLRADDVTVPTMEQLRRLEIIPELERGAARAGSVVTAEMIAELEGTGLDLTPLYDELYERLADEKAKGYIIAQDGTYTTRINRLRDFSLANGVVTESGNGSTRLAMKVLWNQQNPDDQFLNPETGKPYDDYDIPVLWDNVSEDQVLEWAKSVGAPLTRRGNVGKKTQEAWNAAFPDNPYYGEWGREEKVKAGIRPLQGIFTWTSPDGVEYVIPADRPLSEVLLGN